MKITCVQCKKEIHKKEAWCLTGPDSRIRLDALVCSDACFNRTFNELKPAVLTAFRVKFRIGKDTKEL